MESHLSSPPLGELQDVILGRRLDLDTILHVLNAGFPGFVWLLLIHPQTELALNTRLTVSDIRHSP